MLVHVVTLSTIRKFLSSLSWSQEQVIVGNYMGDGDGTGTWLRWPPHLREPLAVA